MSLGFAYWLQTAAPNPEGGPGFANLLLRADIMGSDDGLSKCPYIREGRRLKALKTIVEQEVAIAHHSGPRAAHFDDAVGVGWYPIDIHQVSADEVGASTRTRPFQIPLGAPIPQRVQNLIAANKNIGTTHITNGCYRLHPVEWNIGEAAGLAAAYAIEKNETPRAIRADKTLLRALQKEAVAAGVPLCWLVDVPVWSADFAAIQRLVLAAGYGSGSDSLEFGPDQLLADADRAAWLGAMEDADSPAPPAEPAATRADFARTMMEAGRI